MGANIATVEFSPEEIVFIKKRMDLDPKSALREVLRRFNPAGNNEIVPVVFKASLDPNSKLLYGIIPGVSLSSGSEDGWREAVTARGFTEGDVFRSLAQMMCASFIPHLAKQSYESSACIRVEDETDKPARHHRASVRKAVAHAAIAA